MAWPWLRLRLPGTFEGLGIDLEKVEARSEAWAQDYFTEEEIQAAGEGSQRWLDLTRMWCLKEAALESHRNGPAVRLERYQCSGSR